MSTVNIMLTTSPSSFYGENEEFIGMEELNNYLAGFCEKPLSNVSEHSGGDKAMFADIFIAAVDELNSEDFIKHFQSIRWESAESVQLYIKKETDKKFEVYVPNNLKALHEQ